MPIIERFLDTMYPGIKLQRTIDIYNDRFIAWDFESQLLPETRRRVLVEMKSVRTRGWNFFDANEGIDLLSINEGDSLRALTRHGPFDAYLFVAYVAHNQLVYTRIDRCTTMQSVFNPWLQRVMYMVPKTCFTVCELENISNGEFKEPEHP